MFRRIATVLAVACMGITEFLRNAKAQAVPGP